MLVVPAVFDAAATGVFGAPVVFDAVAVLVSNAAAPVIDISAPVAAPALFDVAVEVDAAAVYCAPSPPATTIDNP